MGREVGCGEGGRGVGREVGSGEGGRGVGREIGCGEGGKSGEGGRGVGREVGSGEWGGGRSGIKVRLLFHLLLKRYTNVVGQPYRISPD